MNTFVHTFLRFLTAFFVGSMISVSAMAQNLGTYFTDLWWNPAESGWGVTVDHQQNIMFLTFFIYRADGSPYWVTATLQKVGTTGYGTSSPQVFTGDVYETHGPSFGVPFNPSAVTIQKVGTATFTGAINNYAAILQYSIIGVNVKKYIQRQTLRNINFSGAYDFQTVYWLSGCNDPAYNNLRVTDSGGFSLLQSGTSITIFSYSEQMGSCTFNGSYSQQGSLGDVAGSYSCTDGTVGTFHLYYLQWTVIGMTALISGQDQSCKFQGMLGGITNNRFSP